LTTTRAISGSEEQSVDAGLKGRQLPTARAASIGELLAEGPGSQNSATPKSPDVSLAVRQAPQAPGGLLTPQQAFTKGETLFCMTSEPTLSPGDETPWTTYGQLTQCGWTKDNSNEPPDESGPNQTMSQAEAPSVVDVLQAYGLPPTTDGSWKRVDWNQYTPKTVNGIFYAPSQGYYSSVYNAQHGAIMVVNSLAPDKVKDPPNVSL
jgi:hypothetical protein